MLSKVYLNLKLHEIIIQIHSIEKTLTEKIDLSLFIRC